MNEPQDVFDTISELSPEEALRRAVKIALSSYTDPVYNPGREEVVLRDLIETSLKHFVGVGRLKMRVLYRVSVDLSTIHVDFLGTEPL